MTLTPEEKLQVAEMYLSEERAEHQRVLRLKVVAQTNAKYWYGVATAAKGDAARCREAVHDMKRERVLAERDARTMAFQNLALTRRLSQLADCFPLAKPTEMCAELADTVSQQANQIAELRAEIGERDGVAEG